MKDKGKRSSRGVTLIALIITIIILLILAGVTLSMIAGESGILTKAQKGAKVTKEETAREEVKLAWTAVTADYFEGEKGNRKVDYYTKQNLNKELISTGEITEFKYVEDGMTTLTYVKPNKNDISEEYYMEIETSGDIRIIEKNSSGDSMVQFSIEPSL